MSARAYLLASLACGACVMGVVGVANCGGGVAGPSGNQLMTTSQFVGVNPPWLLNDPNAIAIDLNQSSTGTIGPSGPWCALWSPLDTYGFPCQTYHVNLPAGGTVRIHITWSEPNQVLCSAVDRTSSTMTCKNTSPVDASYVVTGSAFAFAVGYEGGAASQTVTPDFKLNYSVTATLASTSIAGSRQR